MPVYSSHLLDYKSLGVGQRLRDERQKLGLTLREVAARVNLSGATLSNIETEKIAPDLGQLARFAEALEIPLTALLPRSHTSYYLVKRANDLKAELPFARPLIGPEPGPAVHHNPVWLLADLFVGKHMDPVMAQIKPLPDKDLHFIAHDHEEFMFVLRGEIQTQIKANQGLITETLHPGDCMYFRSNLPHCHRSITDSAAETLNIMYSLRGPADPQDAELDSSGRHFYRRGVYADAAREAGEKIGLLRRSHGITVAELARDVELGPRLLTEIERGQRAPDIKLLMRLALRFRRPIEYFFSTTLEGSPYHYLQRASEIARLPIQHRKAGTGASDDGSRFRALASGFDERGVHPYYVQINTPQDTRPPLIQHHGQQFLHVLEGEVEFVMGADGGQYVVEALQAGDSIFFDSSVPHAFRGYSRNPFASAGAEAINVFWTPLGLQHLFTERENPEFSTHSPA